MLATTGDGIFGHSLRLVTVPDISNPLKLPQHMGVSLVCVTFLDVVTPLADLSIRWTQRSFRRNVRNWALS